MQKSHVPYLFQQYAMNLLNFGIIIQCRQIHRQILRHYHKAKN